MEITNQSNRASSDRLSSLPDSILCHILSSLPTKSSVATSILAKRWRFLWTDLSSFDFGFENHKAKSGDDHQMTIPDIINTFRNVQRINTFRLSYKEEVYSEDQLDFSSDQLGTWIGSIISRNVQALDLCLLYLLRLPSCIFTCTTLLDLRLNRCVGIPSTVCLPNLKKLHLHLVKYEADETFPCLISGCPILEELMVHHIINRYSVCDKISSSTIKWLSLSFEPGMGRDFYDHKLEINTPAVRYLRLEDHVSERISAGTMNSLVEADIWLNNDKVQDDDLYSHSVFEFIEKLSQVQCLRFLSGYPKFLDSVFGLATLMFNNLTKLELGADWRFLMKFLDSADNLEILIISDVDEEVKRWMEPQVVPMCLSSRLRQVTINPFGCSEDEFKMVSYILKNAKVLNMMDIYAQYLGYDFEAKFNALHRISLMETASDTCKLAFF